MLKLYERLSKESWTYKHITRILQKYENIANLGKDVSWYTAGNVRKGLSSEAKENKKANGAV
jgi:hypothetical protein